MENKPDSKKSYNPYQISSIGVDHENSSEENHKLAARISLAVRFLNLSFVMLIIANILRLNQEMVDPEIAKYILYFLIVLFLIAIYVLVFIVYPVAIGIVLVILTTLVMISASIAVFLQVIVMLAALSKATKKVSAMNMKLTFLGNVKPRK